MPRYLIERNFAEALEVTREDVDQVRQINAEEGVKWLFSFLSPDKRKTYCVYDGPSPEAIRRAADCNELPIDRITKVNVLDPYFYL